MTIEEIKKLFEQYQNNELLIENIEERLCRLKSRITSTAAPPLSPLPVREARLKIDDYLIVLERLKKKLLDTQEQMKKAEELIGLVDDPLLQLILRMKYIDGKKWSYVENKVHYCIDNCIRKRNEALKIISDKFVS